MNDDESYELSDALKNALRDVEQTRRHFDCMVEQWKEEDRKK